MPSPKNHPDGKMPREVWERLTFERVAGGPSQTSERRASFRCLQPDFGFRHELPSVASAPKEHLIEAVHHVFWACAMPISLRGEARKCRACSQAWRYLSRRAFCSHYVLVGMRASYFPCLVAVTVPGQGCSFLGITGLHGDTPAFEAIKQPQLESSKPPLCQLQLSVNWAKGQEPKLPSWIRGANSKVCCLLASLGFSNSWLSFAAPPALRAQPWPPEVKATRWGSLGPCQNETSETLALGRACSAHKTRHFLERSASVS